MTDKLVSWINKATPAGISEYDWQVLLARIEICEERLDRLEKDIAELLGENDRPQCSRPPCPKCGSWMFWDVTTTDLGKKHWCEECHYEYTST